MIPDPATQQNIIQYIQQTGGTYTRDAITNQLLASGYPAAEIEAAWRTVEAGATGEMGASGAAPPMEEGAEYAPPRPARVVSSPQFWGALVGFILLSYVMTGILAYFATLNRGDAASALFTITGIFYFVVQLGGLIQGLVLLNRNRPVAFGLLIGLLLTNVVIPFVIACGVLGICIVLLSNPGGFNP
jgi:hypothetical protein